MSSSIGKGLHTVMLMLCHGCKHGNAHELITLTALSLWVLCTFRLSQMLVKMSSGKRSGRRMRCGNGRGMILLLNRWSNCWIILWKGLRRKGMSAEIRAYHGQWGVLHLREGILYRKWYPVESRHRRGNAKWQVMAPNEIRMHLGLPTQ